MGKEDMIRQILKGLESDFHSMSPAELERELKSESTRLSEITYSEVEELYYKVNPSVSLLQV
ncbi:hypothetical protein SKTS_16420 [Sulfurimicrobium lacus]|uniref:Uncharacterized protein n=2 Tax=Sulfurimicrobium lacus TaxID=2715678 RepID=A0A6F8VCL7_9PROT|nr:hypothetical protein SKTS_16420 [Sulfurimicrobium lacus]